MNIRLTCAGLLLAASLGAVSTAGAQERFQFDATPGHLSKQVVPRRYALRFELDPARDSFTGHARIEVRVREPVPAIELHAHGLTSTRVRLLGAGAGAGRTLDVEVLPDSQSWRLTPSEGGVIAAGEHALEFDYAGSVHVASEGLYVAPYQVEGRPRRMLATQLEAIHARTFFPAFDEPSFRAVFQITVRAPKGDEVVSNMPRIGRVVDGSVVEHRFAPTPAMPSYLVSVAVGRFDVLRGRAAGVPLQLLTAEGKRELARYALRVTEQVLPFYSRYFGVPYALPKLDQLAVPSTRWGAMEDWGFISYAEDNLLVDPQRSSPATVRDVFATVAHEIAHQWFGNLVTAASWEEIWLNEAFATWLERKTSDRFNPGWRVPLETRLPIDRAMTLDAGTATRAIRSGPVRETAVFDVFDAITYSKGGSVLSMLEQWIGTDRFQRGLAAYMRGQRLSNATAADLWHHIGRAAGKDVRAMAASWTDQQGFPLVRVSSGCESGRQRVTLTQSRFTLDSATGDAQLWKIPVRMARGRQVLTVLLDTARRSVDLGTCSAEPVVVNAGGQGFYRVAYEADARRALVQQFAGLPAADRVALLSDTFALMQSGQLPLQACLDLLEALAAVGDPSRSILWSVARTQLEFLDTALAGRPAQARLRAIGRQLLAPQLARLGWASAPKEDEQTAELRGTLIALLARFDHEATVAQATRLFDADEAGAQKLPTALREPVTLAVGMHADRPHFDRLLARLQSAPSEEERWMLAKALAAGRDVQRAEELLAASRSGALPANLASALPGLVARLSPFGDLAYRYTVDHWKPLSELSGSWGRSFLLPEAAAGFSTPEQAERLVEDQQRSAGANGDMLAAQEAGRIRLRAAVRAREAAALERSLAD